MFKAFRTMKPDEERYVAPQRPYKLPEYRKGMRCSVSGEPYLRPTRWCNPSEPTVVALAHELGAYELSDQEFAEAAYWWLKTNMWYEMVGFDSPGATIRRGSGMCLHFINTYVSLCRCAGIKARYKEYKMHFRPIEREVMVDVAPGFARIWDATGGTIAEAEAEVYIGDAWVTAYLAQTVALTAATGWAIAEFGESSLGLYFDPLPGSIHRFESIPLRMGLLIQLATVLMPATMERLNVRMSRIQKVGRQEIEDAGGVQEYNRIAKEKRALFSADEILDKQVLKHYDKIIIKDSE